MSHGAVAARSRRVRDGRFHFSSINFSTEVWSYTVDDTKPGRALGLTSTAGTRKP
jgi:hypothetical protein